MPADTQVMKEGPGGEAGAFKETSQSRDQGALDAPILSQSTNQARRGSRKRPDPPLKQKGRGRSLTRSLRRGRRAFKAATPRFQPQGGSDCLDVARAAWRPVARPCCALKSSRARAGRRRPGSADFARSQELPGSTRLRGGGCSPDRTSLLVKFPANREKYKEFRRIRALHCDFSAQSANEVNGFQLNSLCNGTGNFQTRIRENFSRNREFPSTYRWFPAIEFLEATVVIASSSHVGELERAKDRPNLHMRPGAPARCGDVANWRGCAGAAGL